jgi:hypothetical protein
MQSNPDRNFSTDSVPSEELHALLARSEVADILDAAVRDRVGRFIGQAALPPKAWRF